LEARQLAKSITSYASKRDVLAERLAMRTVLGLSLLLVLPGSASASDDDLLLISKHSGKCAQVEGGGKANGAALSQAPCVTEAAVRWQRIGSTDDGQFLLKAVHSAKCAQVAGRSRANRARITQWDCVDQSNVKWKERPAESGYVYLENIETGKCMHVEGASFGSGAVISQWDCVDQNNVKWQIAPATLVKPVSDRDAIVGVWTHRELGPIKVERRDAEIYVITNVNPENSTKNIGETIGEVGYVGTNMLWDYVGRHLWGGSKTKEQYWGQQDALVIRLDARDEMFLAFLDSKYTGGWKFSRVRE
jgi:hypothetical protein